MVENLMIVLAILAVAGLILITQVDNEPLVSLGSKVTVIALLGGGLFANSETMKSLIVKSPVTYAAVCALTVSSVLFMTGIVMRIVDLQSSWRFVWAERKRTLLTIVAVGITMSVYNGVLLFTRVV